MDGSPITVGPVVDTERGRRQDFGQGMESPFEFAARLMTPTGPQGWWEMCAKVSALSE